MAVRLLLHRAIVSVVLLLLLPLGTDATRPLDVRLETTLTSTATTPSTGAAASCVDDGGGHQLQQRTSCASWRLAVETNNLRGWFSIPAECRGYVRDYMFGELFRQDCATVADEARAYAEGLELAGDGMDVWVFDIDDTVLTNLPYYADTGFGAEPYNATEAAGAGHQGRLHHRKARLPDGADRQQPPECRVPHLGEARAQAWNKHCLIIIINPVPRSSPLQPSSLGSSVVPFKSGERQKLVDAGYRIVGNVGDQWSDLLGAPEGARTFKVPDPMYYVG